MCVVFSISPSKPGLVLAPSPQLPSCPAPQPGSAACGAAGAPVAEIQPFHTRLVSADPAGCMNTGNNWHGKMQSDGLGILCFGSSPDWIHHRDHKCHVQW